MVLKKLFRIIDFVGIFVLFLFIPVTQADPIDITYCFSMTRTMVSENEEMTVHSFDFIGIALSNLSSKAFDNMTFHGIGVARDLIRQTDTQIRIYQVHGFRWKYIGYGKSPCSRWARCHLEFFARNWQMERN